MHLNTQITRDWIYHMYMSDNQFVLETNSQLTMEYNTYLSSQRRKPVRCVKHAFYLPICHTSELQLPHDLVHWDIFVITAHDHLRHLPDLDQIILCRTAYYPWLSQIPAKIG